ncbi:MULTISPECIES: hypothetical protein [Streptomyces]|nr:MULTISPECIES: hypothetical protein [unclassified Streptomyces]
MGPVALAVPLLLTGAFVGVLGPLFAVSRSTCQDGVRTPHFGCILVAVAQ